VVGEKENLFKAVILWVNAALSMIWFVGNEENRKLRKEPFWRRANKEGDGKSGHRTEEQSRTLWGEGGPSHQRVPVVSSARGNGVRKKVKERKRKTGSSKGKTLPKSRVIGATGGDRS